jgi:hypothetical protein
MMAKKPNAYLAKQEELRFAYMEAAEAVMKQFMCDTLQIAANEEFGMGAERLARLIKRWGKIYSEYYPCLNVTRTVEADVLRDKLDRLLKPLCHEDFQWFDFEERYPDLKKVRYGK